MSTNHEQSSSARNYLRALRNLKTSLATPVLEPRDLSGIIKDFEMTYELSWKVLKKVLRDQGHQTQGAKDVYAQAFRLGYIDDEATWLSMIEDRNQSAHVYDEAQAQLIVSRIAHRYLPVLEKLAATL